MEKRRSAHTENQMDHQQCVMFIFSTLQLAISIVCIQFALSLLVIFPTSSHSSFRQNGAKCFLLSFHLILSTETTSDDDLIARTIERETIFT